MPETPAPTKTLQQIPSPVTIPQSENPTSKSGAKPTTNPTTNPAANMDVNFLRSQRRILSAVTQKDQIIAKYTSYGFGLFLFILFAVIGTSFYFTSKQKNIEAKTTAITNDVRSMAAFEKEYVIFVRKMKLLYAFDQKRQLKQKTTSFFYSFIPKEDALIEAKVDEQKGALVFQIETPDVFRVLALLQAMYSPDVTAQGYEMKADALDRKPNGRYVISGSLAFASFY